MKDFVIHVKKGKSVCVSGPLVGDPGEWHKITYEVEATLDENEDPAAARQEVKDMINEWLQEPLGPEEKVNLVGPLNSAELDKLPWKTYKTKEPAESGHSGWIKNPLQWLQEGLPPVATRLAKALVHERGKIELGEYSYQISGKEKQFIGRKPIKPKTEAEKKGEKSKKPQTGPPDPSRKNGDAQ